jgi:Tetratricopeptide repeat
MAIAKTRRSLAIRREVGDRRGEGLTLNSLGVIARARGQLEEEHDDYEQALSIAQETQNAELEDAARDNLAEIARLRGAHEASES